MDYLAIALYALSGLCGITAAVLLKRSTERLEQFWMDFDSGGEEH